MLFKADSEFRLVIELVVKTLVEILEGIPVEPKESFAEKALEYILGGKNIEKDSILNNIQKSIALKRLTHNYKFYKDQTSIYDISPEEAAKKTYGTLFPEESKDTFNQLLGITIKYIKKIVNIPEDKWTNSSGFEKRPKLEEITSKINNTIEETKDFSLRHRKRLLTNKYKKAEKIINEKMGSNYRLIYLSGLFY